MSWRPAKSLSRLKRELDRRWPNRDRRTDGMIGDVAHCPGDSDHCPNSAQVVRAFDIDADGIRTAWVAEHLRQLGAQGDPRLNDGGYVIFNRRIASEVGDWRWRKYEGDSPHTDHIHVSVSEKASGYDKGGPWGVRRAPSGPVGPPSDLPRHAVGKRVLKLKNPHMRGTDVAFVQRFVGADDDGDFGLKTKARVSRFKGVVGLPRNGVVGPRTWKKMRVT